MCLFSRLLCSERVTQNQYNNQKTRKTKILGDIKHTVNNYVRKIKKKENSIKNIPYFVDAMYNFALYFFLNIISRVCW